MRRTITITIVASALGACDDETPSPHDLLPRSSCAIAVVASDYRSSTVSLLAADGRPCALDVVHSGSRPPGLLTALSGDVVLPTSGAGADGIDDVLLLDRYPNGIVTRVDPDDDAITAQYGVAPGFAGNPQDIVVLDATTALVSRLERRGSVDIERIDGSDLIIIDLVDGTQRHRIDLASACEPGFDPMPTRLAESEGLVWVGLAHLAPRFDEAGPGRVALVDPDARAVLEVVPVDDATNCGHVSADPAGRGVWAVCSGSFARAGAPQLARSRLAWIDATTRTVAWDAGASELVQAPLGFSLAALDDHRVLVVAIGDLELDRADRLMLIDRTADTATPILDSGAFEIGGLLPSPGSGLVLVAIGDPYAPRIERVRLSDLGREAPITTSTTTGLPPRQLAFFR